MKKVKAVKIIDELKIYIKNKTKENPGLTKTTCYYICLGYIGGLYRYNVITKKEWRILINYIYELFPNPKKRRKDETNIL